MAQKRSAVRRYVLRTNVVFRPPVVYKYRYKAMFRESVPFPLSLLSVFDAKSTTVSLLDVLVKHHQRAAYSSILSFLIHVLKQVRVRNKLTPAETQVLAHEKWSSRDRLRIPDLLGA